MVRLYLQPNFSPITLLMECTPWVSVKVTPQRNAIPVSLVQRIFTLGFCLLFWKTLLPLSIGFAVWYQLREARNEKIQDEIELIEGTPGLLGHVEIEPQSAEFLASRGNFSKKLRYEHLPLQPEASLEDLKPVFGELSKKRQLEIATRDSGTFEWALQQDLTLLSGTTFDPFARDDDFAAAAFKYLSPEVLKASIAASTALPGRLSDRTSTFAQAIAKCENNDRLEVFAKAYPKLALDLAPKRVGDFGFNPLEEDDDIATTAFLALPIANLKECMNASDISSRLLVQNGQSSDFVRAISTCEEDERFKVFAEKHPLYALQLNFERAQRLDLNPFADRSEFAAEAFNSLPVDLLERAIDAFTISDDLLSNADSSLVQAVKTCEDIGRFRIFAQKYPLWALELSPERFGELAGLNPFKLANDELAASAFVNLPLRALEKHVANSALEKNFLHDPGALLTRAIAECDEVERLQVFANKYPVETIRILPQSKWDSLNETQPLSNAKWRVSSELDTVRIEELKPGLARGAVEILKSDTRIIKSLYEACSEEERVNLLKSIENNIDALNALHTSLDYVCFDFSFVSDNWFKDIYPSLSRSMRRVILFSQGSDNSYINRKRIFEEAPLSSWSEFAKIHDPIEITKDATPRKLFRALSQSTSYKNERLIKEISLAHFQEIFKDYGKDPFRLMRVLRYENEKVRWLIENFNLDPKKTADCLVSCEVFARDIKEIAQGLSCENALLSAFHSKCPIPDFVSPLEPPAEEEVVESKQAEVPQNENINSFLRRQGSIGRASLYRKLLDPETSAETLEVLRKQKQTFAQAMQPAQRVNGPKNGVLKYLAPDNPSEAEAMALLVIESCEESELPALCEIALAPVLRHFALKPGNRDFSSFITENSVKTLKKEQHLEIGKLLNLNKKYGELVALAQYIPIKELITPTFMRKSLYDDIPAPLFKKLVPQMKGDIQLVASQCPDEKVQALFEVNPADSLRIGGASLANKVRGTETWAKLPATELLDHLPYSCVLGDPIDENRLKEILQIRPTNCPEELLNLLKTREHIGWAVEGLCESVSAKLIISKLNQSNLEIEEGRSGAKQDVAQLRIELLESYGHMIPVGEISIDLLGCQPKLALHALKNSSLSPDQRDKYISLGAGSADVIKLISQSRPDLCSYLKQINDVDCSHIWLALGHFSNDTDLLSQITKFKEPHRIPMPKGSDQWRCALQVEAFKEVLAELMRNWDMKHPDECKRQIEQLSHAQKKLVSSALSASDSYFAPKERPISQPATPLVIRINGAATPHLASTPSTPTSNGNETPTAKTPVTVVRLRKSSLNRSSPLAQLHEGKVSQPVRPLNLAPCAEELVEQILAKKMTFAEAQEASPNFFNELPGQKIGEERFHLGELCLKVNLADLKEIAKKLQGPTKMEITIFLSEQRIPQKNPKYDLLKHSTVVRSPPLVFG